MMWIRQPLLLLLLLPLVCTARDEIGTLERIEESGRFVIGYTPDAAPLSFEDENGRPAGYAIELCRRIAAAVEAELELEGLEIEYVPLVSPKDRLQAVSRGEVDIECGASTITLSRRAQVDFTLMTLITGASVISEAGSGIRSVADLGGKRVAVIEGTTTERALREFLEANLFDASVSTTDTHSSGMALLHAGDVDAYATDQVMLVGQLIAAEDKTAYTLARDVFSLEPYAFMLQRGDSRFRLVADRALARVYRSAAIRRLYHDWFGRYGVEMSPVLQAMYQFQGLSE